MPAAMSTPAPADTAEIRAAPCPRCMLCGSDGVILYQGQRDRLFGAPGSWNFKRCLNSNCGLIWLDPMPLAEDLGKAYANYYTHSSQGDTGRVGLLKRIYRKMQSGYLAGKYGYKTDRGAFGAWILGKCLYLLPLRRRGLDGDVRFLNALPGGRVLDVGCGSGEWLLFMQKLGWQAEGIDFDEKAVKAARQKGFEVGCGAVEEQHYPDERFDAVALNHVIEHVPDPVATLKECRRILKKGGRLVLMTPNSSSLGHTVFKQDWRGLEPPRHLHVFSNRSMRALLEKSGFRKVSVHSHIADSVISDSLRLRKIGPGSGGALNYSPALRTLLFNLVEWIVIKWNSAAADCVAAIAVKES